MKEETPKLVKQAMVVEVELIVTRIKEEPVVPIATGNLRSTIHAVSEEGLTVSIVAGGPAAPYALEVHENLDAFHRIGQAKYIEDPLRQAVPTMAVNIAKRVDMSKAI
jgi:hypothetical protein